MKKILPTTTPLAYAYQFYAFPLTIHSVHPEATDWVLSNHSQLVYEYSGQAAPVPFAFYLFDYAISPWLETLRFNREWCQLQDKSIAEIVRDAVGRDFYVYLTLNERYVPERVAYERGTDYPHDILIHGVDDREDTFSVLGFDHEQIFRSTTLPQEDLVTAYGSMGAAPYYDVGCILYRFDPAGEYTFDLGFISRGVVEYLESFNTSTHFQAYRDPWDRAYGMETYALLEAYLDGYSRGAQEYDIRNLQVLWEHKRILAARVERCAELVPDVSELVRPFRQLERQAWTLRTQMIAHEAGHGGGQFLTEATALLHQIRDTEGSRLREFAGHLDRTIAGNLTRAAGRPGARRAG